MFRFVSAAVVPFELHGHVADFEFALEQDRDVGQYSILISVFRHYCVC